MDARVEMAVTPEDVQVAAKPQRRSFTAEYKRRLLKEADACTTPGAVGALLRREGVFLLHFVWEDRAAGPGTPDLQAPKQGGRHTLPAHTPPPKARPPPRPLAQ